jgi:DNA polymerase elongation subunit (family B)
MLDVERQCHKEEKAALEAELLQLRDEMANQRQELDDVTEACEKQTEAINRFCDTFMHEYCTVVKGNVPHQRKWPYLRSRAKGHVVVNDVYADGLFVKLHKKDNN